MAKLLYNNVPLPEIDTLGKEEYSYQTIVEIFNVKEKLKAYLLWITDQPYIYDKNKNELNYSTEMSGYTGSFILGDTNETWTIEEEIFTQPVSEEGLPLGVNAGGESFNIKVLWSNYDIKIKGTNNIYFQTSDAPINVQINTYTWDLTEIYGNIPVNIGGITLYRVIDKVFTYQELENSSITVILNDIVEYSGPLSSNLESAQGLLGSIGAECILLNAPKNNFIVEDIEFTLKGLYSNDISMYGSTTEYKSGSITLTVPSILPLYDNEITTNSSGEIILDLNGEVKENDVIIMNYKDTEYYGIFYFDENNKLMLTPPPIEGYPDFSAEGYQIEAISNNGSIYDTIKFKTTSPDSGHLKLIYYYTERGIRKVNIKIDQTEMPLASTTQITILSDNDVTADESCYTYSSSNTNVALVDTSGKVISIAPGTATISVIVSDTLQFYGTTVKTDITVSSKVSNEIYICFSNPNWKNQFPDSYTVTDGANPFYANNTFQYNGLNTYRSSSTNGSTSSIKFNLSNNGNIEFPYRVTSENNYDWLNISIDNVQVVHVSGQKDWTMYNQELSAGEHTITFSYNKDNSGIVSPDCGAIGYLKIDGFLPVYYLVRSQGKLYSNIDGNLSLISTTNLSSNTFLNYGSNIVPNGNDLISLTNPELLSWWDTNKSPTKFRIMVKGTSPVPQIMVTKNYQIPTEGIESVFVDASPDVIFSISFDGGNHWLYYSYETWKDSTGFTDGMTTEMIQNISSQAWYNVSGTATQYKIRFILPETTSYVKSLLVDYINKV